MFIHLWCGTDYCTHYCTKLLYILGKNWFVVDSSCQETRVQKRLKIVQTGSTEITVTSASRETRIPSKVGRSKVKFRLNVSVVNYNAIRKF